MRAGGVELEAGEERVAAEAATEADGGDEADGEAREGGVKAERHEEDPDTAPYQVAPHRHPHTELAVGLGLARLDAAQSGDFRGEACEVAGDGMPAADRVQQSVGQDHVLVEVAAARQDAPPAGATRAA